MSTTDGTATIPDPQPPAAASPAPPATLDTLFEKRDEIVGALRGLGDVATSLGTRSVRERVDRELVRKLEEDRFHLVVVGEFNHGKTTFVNALLGEQALPTGVTPTTATIHHIRWAEKPEATVVTSGGQRKALPFDEAKRFAVGGGASTEDVDYLEIGYPAPLLK
jgi:predicted GTPase